MDYSKKIYHDLYSTKIIKLAAENRLDKAIYEFQKYLKTYPNDFDGYLFYADTLIKLNRLEEAETDLKYIERIINPKISSVSLEYYNLFLVKLWIHQKKYAESLNLLKNNKETFLHNGWEYDKTLLFLNKKLGLESENQFSDIISYSSNQIISYDETKAISHIKKHLNSQHEIVNKFISDFPLEEIYYKLRTLLPLQDKFNINLINNSYHCKYLACGHEKTELVDYIKVIALADSNDIITMYPYKNQENYCHIDLTPNMDDNLKLKRMNQIDKFNQRYNRK